jgi:hypothetical protein
MDDWRKSHLLLRKYVLEEMKSGEPMMACDSEFSLHCNTPDEPVCDYPFSISAFTAVIVIGDAEFDMKFPALRTVLAISLMDQNKLHHHAVNWSPF